MPNIPPEHSPQSHERPEHHGAAHLSGYDRATTEFDRANAALFDTACEMVVFSSETGETKTEIAAVAVDALNSVNALLMETLKFDGDDETKVEMVQSILQTHNAETISLFNQMIGGNIFTSVKDNIMELMITQARQRYGVSDKFVHQVCNDYAVVMQCDIAMLAEAAVSKYHMKEQGEGYDDSLRSCLVEKFYDCLEARIKQWPDYDPEHPDDLSRMSELVTAEMEDFVLTLGLKVGGFIVDNKRTVALEAGTVIVEGSSVIINEDNFIGVPDRNRASGTFGGIAIYPIFIFDNETERPIKTHDLGVYITVDNPTFFDTEGFVAERTEEVECDSLMFPIMGDGMKLTIEKRILN